MFLSTISWIGLEPVDGISQCILHGVSCWKGTVVSRMATWPFLIDCTFWYQFRYRLRWDRRFESFYFRRIEHSLGRCAVIQLAPPLTPASMKCRIYVPTALGDDIPPASWLLNMCPHSVSHHDVCRCRQGFVRRMTAPADAFSKSNTATMCT
jgi:hypothetical protein